METNIHPEDDLWYALKYNPPVQFKVEDVRDIVAEVAGANDEYDWWWVLKMDGGKYFLLSGGCDYTGWDCQSSTEEHGYFDSALLAAEASPEIEKYSDRVIRKNLVGQVKGTQSLYLYQV